jgi:membrane protease YdiL (CAAX protease family)
VQPGTKATPDHDLDAVVSEPIQERTLRVAVAAQVMLIGVGRAILIGLAVSVAGLLPQALIYQANLRYSASIPWGAPLTALYLWVFWRYLNGGGLPRSTAEERRASLRAKHLPGNVWAWALVAGGLGLVALVLAFRVGNRLMLLPYQDYQDFPNVSALTVVSLLVVGAAGAAIVEEAAFRGYMQGPIERRYGLVVAILVTGTTFTITHLHYTLFLWLLPHYVAVAAIYGTVTYLTQSILPSVVLHTGWNLYSNLDAWLHGQVRWPGPSGPTVLIWNTGADASFWILSTSLVIVAATMVWAYSRLARATRYSPT